MVIDSDVRRLALACLLLGYEGPEPPAWVDRALGEGLAGLVLFGSNLGDGTDVRRLTDRFRSAAGRDVVLAVDEEGGDVTRLDTVRGSASPGAAALGHLDDPQATERVYAAIGRRLADAGITVDLAPVGDVNCDPDNPVIGVRSFGADPELVSRQVAAAVRGLQSAGVAACVKHFPGHGATSTDSHHEVARLDRTADQLEQVELPPFAAAVAAGTRAVMTGHLLVPALDPDHLATVSTAITTDLLRGRLGFTGTVVTDALEMRAVADTLGLVEGFVRALAAGADAIETGARAYPDLVEQIPAAVQRALDTGSLARERLADAATRTAELARPANSTGDLPDTSDVAARCLEVTGPVPELVRPLVVEARPPGGMASGELPWSFADALAARLPGVELVPVDHRTDPARVASVAGERSVILVVRDPHRHRWQQRLFDLPADLVIDVGWPAEVPPGPPVIRTRGVAPALLAAAADRLPGAVSAVTR